MNLTKLISVKKPHSLSIIVPCYNEEEVLGDLFDALEKLKRKIKEKYSLSVEFVFVNDGSSDNTANLLDNFISKHKGRVVHLAKNYGHQKALRAGYEYAKGDLVVTIDADLQDPPDVILEMLDAYFSASNIQMVLAQRKSRNNESLVKIFTAKAFYFLMKLISRFKIPDNVADFRLLTKDAIEILLQNKNTDFWRGMVMAQGFNYKIVKYDRQGRAAGSSHYSLSKMLKLAFEGIILAIDLRTVLILIGTYVLATVMCLRYVYEACDVGRIMSFILYVLMLVWVYKIYTHVFFPKYILIERIKEGKSGK